MLVFLNAKENFPLSSLVAASSAVPGLLAPQKLGEHFYIDGGVRSGVSVDWAHPSETLVVVAPSYCPEMANALPAVVAVVTAADTTTVSFGMVVL